MSEEATINPERERCEALLRKQIEHHRGAMLELLGDIGDRADKPLKENCRSLEEAVMVRLQELQVMMNNVHMNIHHARALRRMLRKVSTVM